MNINNISLLLCSVATALVTLLGLTFVAYSFFWQRFVKPLDSASSDKKRYKTYEEEKWLRNPGKWWIGFNIIIIVMDFSIVFGMNLLEDISTEYVFGYTFYCLMLSFFALVGTSWYACWIAFPDDYLLANVAYMAERYPDAINLANNYIQEVIPHKIIMKKILTHPIYALKGMSHIELAESINEGKMDKSNEKSRIQEYKNAIDSFQHSLEFKKCPNCLMWKGIIHVIIGEKEDARRCFEKAKKLDKRTFDKYYANSPEVKETLEEQKERG